MADHDRVAVGERDVVAKVGMSTQLGSDQRQIIVRYRRFFVDEEHVDEEPAIVIGEPEDEDRAWDEP